MDKNLTFHQKLDLASEFEIGIPTLDTVLEIESSGSGFDPKTGLIKIQFEPYHFRKYTGKRIANGVENQAEEWAAYKVAEQINKEAAQLSTSYGLGQVMGFNHKDAGFGKVSEMVDSFMISEANQLRGMLTFIKSNKSMYNALVKKDWAKFAYYYNGENYKDFQYDTKLKKAFEKHSGISV